MKVEDGRSQIAQWPQRTSYPLPTDIGILFTVKRLSLCHLFQLKDLWVGPHLKIVLIEMPKILQLCIHFPSVFITFPRAYFKMKTPFEGGKENSFKHQWEANKIVFSEGKWANYSQAMTRKEESGVEKQQDMDSSHRCLMNVYWVERTEQGSGRNNSVSLSLCVNSLGVKPKNIHMRSICI